MLKRYQISHYFNKWISAESFNTLLGATNFARRVLRANSSGPHQMHSVKVIDRTTKKTKFIMDRKDN